MEGINIFGELVSAPSESKLLRFFDAGHGGENPRA